MEHRVRNIARLVMLLPLLVMTTAANALAGEEAFTQALTALAEAGSYADKSVAATSLASSAHARAEPVLSAMLAGALYKRSGDGRVVTATESGDGFALQDAATGESLGTATKSELDRITVNNALRTSLRGMLATLKLRAPDAKQRLAAIREVGESDDLEMRATLAELLANEQNAKVRTAIETALATLNLDSEEPGERMAAIDRVTGSMSAHVRTKLAAIAGSDGADEAARTAARHALAQIEKRVAVFDLVQTAFFGLSLGSILVLAAIGLSVTFGIMGVINMAHGELMMLGAYTTYVVQQLMPNALGASLFVAMPAAFLVAGLVGVAIERGIVRRLYGRPLETLLATFGVSLVLQQSVRTIFSPLNRSVVTPDWLAGSVQITPGLDVTLNRIYILLFSLLVFGALQLVLKRTRLGLEMRAVTQNRAMAAAMGIRTDRVDALTFGLGAGIAGLAGVALSQLTNVGPNLGQAYIVDSFMVVVFGGVGNLWGTLVSGLSLGLASKLIEPAAGAVMAKIFVLLFLIVFIQKRPRGLFPQKGRAAEA
jgi:urea transport system permease protein